MNSIFIKNVSHLSPSPEIKMYPWVIFNKHPVRMIGYYDGFAHYRDAKYILLSFKNNQRLLNFKYLEDTYYWDNSFSNYLSSIKQIIGKLNERI